MDQIECKSLPDSVAEHRKALYRLYAVLGTWHEVAEVVSEHYEPPTYRASSTARSANPGTGIQMSATAADVAEEFGEGRKNKECISAGHLNEIARDEETPSNRVKEAIWAAVEEGHARTPSESLIRAFQVIERLEAACEEAREHSREAREVGDEETKQIFEHLERLTNRVGSKLDSARSYLRKKAESL